MNIFNIEKTEAELKADEVRRCAEYRKGTLEALTSAFTVSFNDIFNNSILTPQEHFDFFGNNAAQFFQTFTATAQFIKSMNPDFEVPTIPYEYIVNDDGTITVGEKIEVVEK